MLESIGYDETTAAALAPWAAADAAIGRVTTVEPGLVTLIAREGLLRASAGGALLNQLATHPVAGPCPGDWCVVRRWPDRRLTVERVLPRRTAIYAGTVVVGQVPLAANVDLVAVVVGDSGGLSGAGRTDLVARVRHAVRGVAVTSLNAADALSWSPSGRTVALVGDPRRTATVADQLVGARSIAVRRTATELRVGRVGGAVLDLGLSPVTGVTGGQRDTPAGRRP